MNQEGSDDSPDYSISIYQLLPPALCPAADTANATAQLRT